MEKKKKNLKEKEKKTIKMIYQARGFDKIVFERDSVFLKKGAHQIRVPNSLFKIN